MKEQFEQAKEIIDDIITIHIQNMYDIDLGEWEDKAEIEAALKLIFKLAEQSVK